MYAVLAGIFLCALIVLVVILVGHGRVRYLKRARKSAEDTEYEEVGDIIVEPRSGFVVLQSGFSLDMNACYSLKQDPVYAEIEEGINTKLNDAYGSRSFQARIPKPLTDSSLPPRPLADQEKHTSGDEVPTDSSRNFSPPNPPNSADRQNPSQLPDSPTEQNAATADV